MNVTLRLFDGYPHTSGHLQPDVLLLQEQLVRAGFPVVCDGYFGADLARGFMGFP